MGFGASRDAFPAEREARHPSSREAALQEVDALPSEGNNSAALLPAPADNSSYERPEGGGATPFVLAAVDFVRDPNQRNSVANFSPMMTFQNPSQSTRDVSNFGGPLPSDAAEGTAVIEEFDLDTRSSGISGGIQETGNTTTELPNFTHVPATPDAFSPEDGALATPAPCNHQPRSSIVRGGTVSIVEESGPSLTFGLLRTASGAAAHQPQRHVVPPVNVPADGQESSGKSHTISRSVDTSLRVRFDYSSSRGIDGASSFSTLYTMDTQRDMRSREGGESSFSANNGEIGNGSFERGSTLKLPHFDEVGP